MLKESSLRVSQIVGERVLRWRVSHGYSNTEFAKLICEGPQTLGRIERGVQPIDIGLMCRLCNAMNMTLCDLVGEKRIDEQFEDDVAQSISAVLEFASERVKELRKKYDA